MMTFRKEIIPLLLIAVTLAIVAGESIALFNWLVDDSAISFAYARNLFNYGELTHQIGSQRVEGFSNPLWVFLLAACQIFTTNYKALKFLGIFIYALALLRLSTANLKNPKLKTPCQLAALLVSLQPSVAIWCLSGLENPLYLLLGIELLICSLEVATGNYKQNTLYRSSIAAALISLTRPEGIIYTIIFPATARAIQKNKENKIPLTPYIVFTITTYACYILFRLYYFGSSAPNTYMAKGGPSLKTITEIVYLDPYIFSKFMKIPQSIFGWEFQTWGIIAFGLATYHSIMKGEKSIVLTSLFFATVSGGIFLLLPADWMPENRFATLFYPPFYFLISFLLFSNSINKYTTYILTASLLTMTATQCLSRVSFFIKKPTISIEEVKEKGITFERWSRILKIDNPSILIADIGGILILDKIKIIDLGMLCDKEIAESLGEANKDKNMKKFYDYIFNDRKPSFISTRAYHSYIANLDDDQRFRRDYVPIKEYVDQWIVKRHEEEKLSGDYVRKDLVKSNETYLKITAEASLIHYPFCKECRGTD